MATTRRATVHRLADRRAPGPEGAMNAGDGDLSHRFRDGDPAAVRAVYDRYAGAVTTVAVRLLGDRDLAADAVQRTFVRAWRAAGTFDPERPLAPWLYAIARRVAIDVWREEDRVARNRAYEGSVDTGVAPATFEHAWEAWEVRTALDDLPEDEREVLRLTHFAGLTQTEAAERLDIPVGTVKSRSHRAHRRLAARLSHLSEVAG